MREPYKVIFWGTPEFALPSLTELIRKNYQVVACVTRPDRPSGRGRVFKFSPIKELALKRHIPVFQPLDLTDPEFLDQITKLKADVFVVVAFGKILPGNIINLPKNKCINVHASLLPKYRGASPIHFALLEGEKETGVTVMQMDEKMDTGPIIAQERVKIDIKDDCPSLQKKLAERGGKLLGRVIDDYMRGRCQLTQQEDSKATYTKILKKEDGKIDWSDDSPKIARMVRAFNPWPGTFSLWRGKILKIVKVKVHSEKNKITPGKIVCQDKSIYVGTADAPLEILELQLAGRKPLKAADFVSGYPDFCQILLT